jgi:hypothetical protein
MAETTEPRALTAALASPAFVTQAASATMHTANRHVERWAPEAGASRVRPLRNLGFVDRLVSPWIEAAQRSASLRLFSQYIATGAPERQGSAVSWVFPRPWYQDELDWMTAARHAGEQARMEQPAPTMLTTRGTYVPAAQSTSTRAEAALPTALYEYVAPSLSLARPADAPVAAGADAYSPLVPFAAAQAAQVMARVIAPLQSTASGQQAPRGMMTAGLRAVLSTMLERTAVAGAEQPVTRLAGVAPELVTPPAPRPDADPGQQIEQQVIRQASEQRAHVAELQRVARVVAERELAAREAAARQAASTTTSASTAAPAADAERARIEARIAERLAERQAQATQQEQRQRAELAERQSRATAAQRLHEQARDAAARDARDSAQRELIATSPTSTSTATPAPEARPATPSIPAELTAAIAAMPPDLASTIAAGIGQHPERAVQAIREVDEALRAVELIARTSAAGGTFESTRGPRLVMPAGLGGLVATVERATTPETPRPIGAAAVAAELSAAHAAQAQAAARERQATRTAVRVPSIAWLAPEARDTTGPAPTSALGAAAATTPAALHHVAWADRWLARFAGAAPRSLEVLDLASASPETRLATLAAAAPGTVWVAPELRGDGEAARTPRSTADDPSSSRTPVLRSTAVPTAAAVRFADDAETPDDVFAAISAGVTRTRTEPAQPARPSPAASIETPTLPRETLADLVAHAAPSAPGAGFAAQLASSPFAAALRHVLPMPAAASFDVRALFGSGLVTSYLAGLVAAGAEASGQASAPASGLRPGSGDPDAWCDRLVAHVRRARRAGHDAQLAAVVGRRDARRRRARVRAHHQRHDGLATRAHAGRFARAADARRDRSGSRAERLGRAGRHAAARELRCARHGRRSRAELVGRAGAVGLGSLVRLRPARAGACGARLRARSGRGRTGGAARDRRSRSALGHGRCGRSNVRPGDEHRCRAPCRGPDRRRGSHARRDRDDVSDHHRRGRRGARGRDRGARDVRRRSPGSARCVPVAVGHRGRARSPRARARWRAVDVDRGARAARGAGGGGDRDVCGAG